MIMGCDFLTEQPAGEHDNRETFVILAWLSGLCEAVRQVDRPSGVAWSLVAMAAPAGRLRFG